MEFTAVKQDSLSMNEKARIIPFHNGLEAIALRINELSWSSLNYDSLSDRRERRHGEQEETRETDHRELEELASYSRPSLQESIAAVAEGPTYKAAPMPPRCIV
jgi:hypothetical protein